MLFVMKQIETVAIRRFRTTNCHGSSFPLSSHMEYTFSLHNSQAEEGLTPAASAAPYLAPPSTFVQPDTSIAPPNDYQFTFTSQYSPIHTPLQPGNASICLPLQNLSNCPSPAPQLLSAPATKTRISHKRKTTYISQQTSGRPSKQRRIQPPSTTSTSVFGVTPPLSKHQNQQSTVQESLVPAIPVSRSSVKPARRVAQSRRHQPTTRNRSRAAATDIWWFCYGVNSKQPPLGLNPSQVQMDDEDRLKSAPDTTRVRCRLCP